MTRQSGSDRNGRPFSKSMVDKVFAKASSISGTGESAVGRDKCGASIRRGSHGLRSEMGWQIDHIKPVSKDGSDDITNLQPLHWENNQSKKDGPNSGFCKKR